MFLKFLNSTNTTKQAGDRLCIFVFNKKHIYEYKLMKLQYMYKINATIIQPTLLWLLLILHTWICTDSTLSRVRTRPEKLVQTQGAELYRTTDE